MEDLALDSTKAIKTPQQDVRRWLLELKLSKKREKDYRETGKKILETYRGVKRKKNSFNILWANTETLRPALYNSTPKPDVRRRFRQNDMLGKAVAEVSERSISYCVDAYDLDACIKNSVLDALLPGRGIDRVRYVPKIKTSPAVGQTPASDKGSPLQGRAVSGSKPSELDADTAGEAFAGDREEVEYEQALCEHVQWDDYLQGPGKTWEEVCWIAFCHRLTKDDIIEKFGKDIAKEVRLDDASDSDVSGDNNKDIAEVFKRAEFWEIWDKDGERVFFVNESYKKGLIYPKAAEGEEKLEQGAPPLKLKNFYPIPEPLRMVEDTGTQIPSPLYELYREQADELDRVSGRINKIVNACRVRFAHDPSLTELKGLMDATDNEGIPVENARAWMTNGGLDKAIWWMPIEQLAMVLKELYVARDQAKQVIYEITGISDIIRGVTNPNETLGAQKLKANSSSLRLQRMQREVQRYVRDIIRLLAEVIGENFDPQTLAQMTGLKFPTNLEKRQMQLKAQAASAQQQPIPEQIQQALQMPSWEDVMQVLRSDMQREYRVDVETDSTVAQSLQQDMEGLKEVLTSLVEFWQGVGPAVSAQAISMDAVKAISMSIVRRARMGLEVEDALESGMQQPKPQDNGEAAKVQAEQAKQAAEAQKEQAKQQAEASKAQADAQVQAAKESEITRRQELEAKHKQAMDTQQKVHDQVVKEMELDREYEFKRWEVEQNNAAKITVAEISAKASVDATLVKAEQAANEEVNEEMGDGGADVAQAKTKKRSKPIDKLADMHKQSMDMHGKTVEAIAGLAKVMAAKKRVTRDPKTGRVDTVEPVMA